MKIEDMIPFIPDVMKMRAERMLVAHEQARALQKQLAPLAEGDKRYHAHANALLAQMDLEETMTLAFRYCYLGLTHDNFDSEDEMITLYNEISEYMKLVRAGMISFVATHPIKKIEEAERNG